jgi:hypothetical protein
MGWFDDLVGKFTSPSGLGTIAALGGSALMNNSSIGQTQIPPTGYQGSIPEYTAVRAPVQNTYDPNRRPGSGGQRYFSDTKYTSPADAAAAQVAAQEQAQGLAALNAANPAQQRRAAPPPTPAQVALMQDKERRGASSVIEDLPLPNSANMAQGGLATLNKGRYLKGGTDGMADKVPARINGKQEARLSDGEFVIPADVVSHLGNGNSDAGAKMLHDMMNKVRKARTGNDKQGKQIDPNKFLPK